MYHRIIVHRVSTVFNSDFTPKAYVKNLNSSSITLHGFLQVQPYLILEDANLGAFTVDHSNFRLLVPHHIRNTVISVSLDGREVVNLRANTQQPKFKNVVSLAMANGLFYWTNGEEVLIEGYHSGQNRYFHNAYPDR